MTIEHRAQRIEGKLRENHAGIFTDLTPEQRAEIQGIMRERLTREAANDAATLRLILADERPVSTGRLVRGGRLKRNTTRLARRIIRHQQKARAKWEVKAAPSPLMRAHEAIDRHQTWLNNKELTRE